MPVSTVPPRRATAAAYGGHVTKQRPETLEGRWDILYRDYPEVYEQWGTYTKTPDMMDVLNERFGFAGRRIADIGSGSGISSFELARYGATVVGIEIEPAMLAIAQAKAREAGLTTVTFERGDAEHIPLADGSVDMAIGATLAGGDVRVVAAEMERVVGDGGCAMRVDVAPGWYGGEFNPIIDGVPREQMDEPPYPGSANAILPSLGYEVMDVMQEQRYPSVEDMVATYGFIHGKAVIDHIRANGITSMQWKFRVHYKAVHREQP